MRWLSILLFAATASAGELHDAAAAGDVDRVKVLVVQGADIDAFDENKGTALLRAAEKGHTDVVRLLLEYKADPNKASNSLTPLYRALALGHAVTARLLVKRGGTFPPQVAWGLADFPKPAEMELAPILRVVVWNGGDDYVVPVASLLWDVGPIASAGVERWLEDGKPQVRRTALLALRHIARRSDKALAALVRYEAGLETVGWQGRATPAGIEALTAGVESDDPVTRAAAVRACTRLDWPAKPEDEIKDASKALLKALSKARKDKALKTLVAEAIAAVKGRREISVPGHPEGRAVRRERDRGTHRAFGEQAVDLGLAWLAAHQDAGEDGKWDCDGFMKHDPQDDRCDGPGSPAYDVGATGLALLAFLGAGHEPYGASNYAPNVRVGLRYLTTVQDKEGCFGGRSDRRHIFNHAIATLAMCEAAILSGHPMYEHCARRGLAFIRNARNADLAWRYTPRGGENSTAVTTWCLHALQAGKLAGFGASPEAVAGGLDWIRRMTDPEFGRIGYTMPGGSVRRPDGLQDRFPPEKSEAMTSAGIFVRLLLQENARRERTIQRGAERCMENPPVWNPDSGAIDMYYWHFGTLALHQFGGKPWREWSKALEGAIVRRQHPAGSGSRTGSWDPIGPWGGEGGRVYSTAMMVLTLETPYRYARGRNVR